MINSNQRLLGYHITSKRFLPSILKNGLIPKIPVDFGDGGDTKAVYLFKSLSDMENAMWNWMGEKIEELEEKHGKDYLEICLEVDLTGMENSFVESVEFEFVCVDKIPPSRILRIFDI